MPLYRKVVIIITNNLFRLLLFFSISIVAFIFIYSSRSYLPNTLETSGVYERFVSSLLETNKNQPLTVGGSVTLDDPEIQKIITTAFPAEELQLYVETTTNAFYDWLEQKEQNIAFTIDLTRNKQMLAEGLSSYAISRMQTLPLCSVAPAEIDPFNATCQSPNIDYASERLALTERFLNEPGFLENPIITNETILPESFDTDYQQVPTYYSLGKIIPFAIPLLLLVLALIVIFASSTKKIGIRKIGQGLVGSGVSLIIFTVLFSFVVPNFTGSLPIFQTSGDGIDTLLNEVSVQLSQDYAIMVIKLAVPLVILGSALLFFVQIQKNKKDYRSAKLKSGIVSSNEQKKSPANDVKKSRPPVQSSESSDTKPKKSRKSTKYRKIPKKELS